MKTVAAGGVAFANDRPLALIAGPCQIESADHAKFMARELAMITKKIGIPFVFKASFDKANRTSHTGPRGIGLKNGLKVFSDIKAELNVPILTDVHEAGQCAQVAEVADILQIPAFLSRQTDLVVAAAETGRIVNIKKGQFMAPWDVAQASAKASATGNDNILLTERGVSFGYNTLVVDMRALPIMKRTGYPVIFDATHSVQQPGGRGASSGGQREFAVPLARASVAVGIAGVFIETHDDPDKALSDGPNMIPLAEMEGVLRQLTALDKVAKSLEIKVSLHIRK